MLMQMVIMLIVANVLLDWLVAWTFPAWLRFTEGKMLIDVIVSMATSFLMGKYLFQMSGLVAGIAGIASSVISPFGYPAIRWLQQNREQIPIWKENTIQGLKAAWHLAIWLPMLIIKAIKVIIAAVQWCRGNKHFNAAMDAIGKIQSSAQSRANTREVPIP